MKLTSRFFALALPIALAATACADIVGNWTGTVKVDRAMIMSMPPPPGAKAASKEDKERAVQMAEMMAKSTKFTLTIKKDHTYISTIMTPKMNGSLGGKWSISGNTVTLETTSAGGKPVDGTRKMTQKLTLSGGGKTMTMRPSKFAVVTYIKK
ncbi:MAG: hypothetical protein JSS72_08295 [Armatimonadetes bacterium]|nr:hypothetical protein [Armatimonadota bacterium]